VHEGSVEWLRLLKPLIEVGALPSGAQEPNMLQALCAVRELDLLMTYADKDLQPMPSIDALHVPSTSSRFVGL